MTEVDVDHLVRVSRNGFLADMEDQAFERLSAAGRLHVITPGTTVPDRRRVCIVLDGELSLATSPDGDEPVVLHVPAGGHLDPRRLGPVSPGLVTQSPATVLTIPPSQFDRLVEQQPSLARHLESDELERNRRVHLAGLLREHFPTLDQASALRHASHAEIQEIAAGSDLCAQGDAADVTFLVLRGRLRAIREDGSELVTLGEVGPGALLGESALIEDGARQATLRAVRNTTVAIMTREWLRALMLDDVQAATGVIGQVIKRIRKEPPFVTRDHVVTIVPTGPDVHVIDLADNLVAAIGQGSWDCRVVHPSEAQERFGLDDDAATSTARSGRLRAWLDDLDRQHDFVVLVATSEFDDWTREVVEQADRLVLAANAADSHRISPVEMSIATQIATGVHSRRTLLLLHDADVSLPSGTAAWLDARDVDDHLHVRPALADDVARLGRTLAGEPVAVAVGGGGARAMAAVGVYEVMYRRGIPIDVVAGTSMGAVVAAGIAMGLTPEEGAVLATTALSGLKDFTLPIVSLVRGKALWDRMQETYAGIDIEDLWIPFGCTSTDLTAGTGLIHRRGSLMEAIRASVAVPGMLPPVDRDGHVLVDGAVMDNLPVNVVTEIAPLGHVLAIDVSAPQGPVAHERLPRHVSGVRALLGNLVPGLRPVPTPSLVRVIMQSTVVGAARRRREVLESGRVDCYVSLDLDGFTLVDFDRIPRIIEIGRRDAAAPIDAWIERSRGTDRPVPRTAGAGLGAPTGDGADRTAVSELAIARQVAEESGIEQAWHRALGVLHLTVQDLRYRARRFVVAMGGTAVVLTLLLLMTGLVAQFDRETEVTAQTMGASHWVVPAGVEGPFTSTATLPTEVAAAVTPIEGGRADPVLLGRTRYTIDGEGGELIVVGHGTGLGRPTVIVGRPADSPGELAVSEDAGLALGTNLDIGAMTFEVVGIVGETTILAGIPLAFFPAESLLDVFGAPEPVVSAVLLDAEPASLPDGVTVLSSGDVAQASREPLDQAVKTINLVRVLLAIVAAMIISTVTYLATMDRQRDVAVLRAMGTSPGALGGSVALQAVLLALIAAAMAMVLQSFVAPAFPMRVHLTSADFMLLPVIAAGIAGLAAYGAIRQTLKVDPASAFGGPGA